MQSHSSATLVLVGVPPDATVVSVVSADILAFFGVLFGEVQHVEMVPDVS